jgi:hypothetical protein
MDLTPEMKLEFKTACHKMRNDIKQYYDNLQIQLKTNKRAKLALSKSSINTNQFQMISNLMVRFPMVVCKENLSSIYNLFSKICIIKNKISWKNKLISINELTTNLVNMILPYTGANLIIDNMPNIVQTQADIYDLINMITPVLTCCLITPKTALFTCYDSVFAQIISTKIDNKVIVYEDEPLNPSYSTDEYIKCKFITTKAPNIIPLFDWHTKSYVAALYNPNSSSCNTYNPITDLLDYSSAAYSYNKSLCK